MVQPQQIIVLAGPTFMVSDARGDVSTEVEQPEGLFHHDMRHLSQWAVRVNGRSLEAMAAEEIGSDRAVIYLQEPTGSVYSNPTLSIVRRRHVDGSLHESLEVSNHDVEQVRVSLSLAFAADFADIFEVKDHLGKAGSYYQDLGHEHVTLGYRREGYRRETTVYAGPGFYTRESVEFQLVLDPGQTWRREIEVNVDAGGSPVPPRPIEVPSVEEWLAEAPELETDSEELRHLYRQSLVDLAALQFHPDTERTGPVPAAGLPWFMALFGRDSLITSFQALPYAPGLARGTLLALAACQASDFDDFRDAEPGKILHELRHGELVHFRQRPHSPYYGSVDSTPLFLVLLDEYERWTGDVETVRELEPHARAAIRWLEEYADLDGDGFIEYATRNPQTGLVNQGWKDSWNAIIHPDGRIATRPHAVCEVQGYAYDARRRAARLARDLWDDQPLASRLEQDAAELRRRFEEAFWLPTDGFYALALDAAKEPVRTLASNMGHLLWSGIVPEDHVDQVAAHLLGDQMFSGWGVRTLAAGQASFNPMEYHNGTVWPHDNALIAAGLVRYGRREEAARIARGLLDAGPHVAHRLPEALVGAHRDDVAIPVPYPSACSPQAWAAGTTLMLITAVLGLDIGAGRLLTAPHLPDRVGRVELRGVPTRFGRLSTT